ncbi:MAG TPA: DEAD/DEAH box helicase [Candidatus Ruthenibacterium merdavium]|uniref:ATP-dependent RNA helicase CshA n=1 Tax=Candidatus Ruthenibacterium merdavium TaxID=2838752 RepID=A0A9D2Q6L6_9FIRM|nr:DEAD/DEAH box helicase [Candidatus Ruthenibacterium merdavium]
MNFSDLQLQAPLLRAVKEFGYETPSPIQQKAIVPVLQGSDLLACAQTGTGKTAAFALPILQNLAHRSVKGRPVRALILTPTRELALQIDECIEAYARYLPVSHTVIYGGVGQAPQVAALQRGAEILTATPGRLLDLMQQGKVSLDQLEVFVLDEADRMLDMGFIHDVRRVIRALPQKRQTLLFSATMPPEIERLAHQILHRPKKVMVAPPSTTVERIEQSVYFAEKPEKKRLLPVLLRAPEVESALVFTRTKHGANRVAADLTRAGIEAMAIHGNKSQTARQTALCRLKSGDLRVLVATDIAARGIDVSGLSHVVNYDLPNVPETYVHRIGRTGRAGRAGVALSFCSEEERPYLKEIEKQTRQKIPVRQTDDAKEADLFEGKERENVMEQQEKQTTAREPSRRRTRRGKRGQGGKSGRAGKPEQAAKAVQETPSQKNAEKGAPKASKPERAPKRAAQKNQKPERPAPQKERFSEEDNSIQLISRRAPTQKYASFEEYMKAHGGSPLAQSEK